MENNMMDTMFEDSPTRTPKFTEYEQSLLNKFIKKYKHIIMCKKTGIVKPKFRDETWDKIEAEFNADPKVLVGRSKKQLQNKWDYLKRTAKKEASLFKSLQRGTGGGPPPAPLSDTTNFLLATVRESVVGVASDFDSDREASTLVVMGNEQQEMLTRVNDQSIDIEEIDLYSTRPMDLDTPKEKNYTIEKKDQSVSLMEKGSDTAQSKRPEVHASQHFVNEDETNEIRMDGVNTTPKLTLKRMTRKKQLESNKKDLERVISVTTPQYTRTKFVELAEKKKELAEIKLAQQKKQQDLHEQTKQQEMEYNKRKLELIICQKEKEFAEMQKILAETKKICAETEKIELEKLILGQELKNKEEESELIKLTKMKMELEISLFNKK